MLESKIKVLLSTIPIALLGAVMVLGVQSAALPALAQPAQETFFESDVRGANETQGGGGEAAAAGAALLRQGQISSSLSDVPGRDDTQAVVIVPPRDDNAVLSGILTFQASRPVDLFVWNNVELENTTAIPEEFGDLDDIVNIGGKTFALAEVGSGNSASVPFTGNAVEVVGEDEPFIVTYSLNAFPALANLVSDLQSLNSFNATAAEEGDDAGNDDDEG
ncbi:MAG: hypothetical protein GEU26_14280 [Nitrososphaeraceae archaeon]|nr:hypothetical protein [Nitrososphaeraceae archaeon]